MRRLMTAICCACMVSVMGLGAQSGNMGKMDMKEMKVTGCVAQGAGMGQFMLNNAMMSGDMKADMKKDDMKMKDGMKPMSYMLMGGDLKGHMGHKVEVTGTMGDEKMMKQDSMAKDKMMADAKMLTVKSVKMISPTCP
ncbi:MAG: hypothetical protein ABI024_10510 [Vicinamibacterales bacterium]